MSHSNIYTNRQVPIWKKLVGFLVLVAVLFLVGAIAGFLKSDIGSADALRQGYMYARAGLVMLFVAAVVLKVCKILKVGDLPSAMIGFAAAMGSMQATCDALNGKYDDIAATGLNGVVMGVFCGAILHWRQVQASDRAVSRLGA